MVDQFRITTLAMNDHKIKEVFGSRRGVQRVANLEFVGEYSRKGPGMLDEQVLVALADHEAHAEVQRGQENEMRRDHARRDEIREGWPQSCHTVRKTRMRLSPSTSLSQA